MSDRELVACGRLSTVLLCGEQSAIQLFSVEIERNRQRGSWRAVRDLIHIERDEHRHEHALSSFHNFLPTSSDQHFLKRRAQRFFAGLGRIESLSDHFIRISQLDTAVCKIMWHVENAKSDNVLPLQQLASRIKLDEARHVSISRRYARDLGYDRHAEADWHERFRIDLVDMLEPLAVSFEDIGVDAKGLFRHLLKD